MKNALTIDLEEYFHPSEVQPFVHREDWSKLPSRVEDQTRKLLDLLAARRTRVTFFILGWVAERHPRLLRAIVDAGHEIGCHSYAHELVYRMTPEQFRLDTIRALSVIGDATGSAPTLYRAPSYSIRRDSFWALEILVECGIQFDSSIYPISHDRYGIPGSERHCYVIDTPVGPITEIPIATAKLSSGGVVPIGGGGYLRLLPYRYTSAGIRQVNLSERRPVCIYLHPWEIDPDQPRLATGRIARVRTYMGLKHMFGKLERLLTDFSFSTISEVYGSVRKVEELAFAASAR
jgi:polysaccharide deacetylase family protein (PEP-CTERM system associated)